MVALGAAELDVGDDLGDEDLADKRPVGVEDVDAIVGAGPDAALDVEPEAIEESGGAGGEDLPPGEGGVDRDGEAADVARPHPAVRGAGIRDVEQTLVGREGDAVRLTKSSATRVTPRCGVDAEDIAAVELHLGEVPLVVGLDAVGGIGEPDGVVRFDDDVVRAVEPLALVAIGDGGDGAVELGAADAAPAVLAARSRPWRSTVLPLVWPAGWRKTPTVPLDSSQRSAGRSGISDQIR